MGSRMASYGGTGMSRLLHAALDLVLQPWLVVVPKEWPELGLDAPILTPLDSEEWPALHAIGPHVEMSSCYTVEGLFPACLDHRAVVMWVAPQLVPYVRGEHASLIGWLYRENRRLLRRYVVILTVEAALR